MIKLETLTFEDFSIDADRYKRDIAQQDKEEQIMRKTEEISQKFNSLVDDILKKSIFESVTNRTVEEVKEVITYYLNEI